MSIKKIFSSDKNRLFQTPEFEYMSNSIKNPSSKNILKNNGGNIIYKDFSNYTIPNKNTEKSTNNTTAYGIESKINELESKIYALEEKNESLLNRLNNTEQMYELKIKRLEKNNMEDKIIINRAKQEIDLLNQINNENSNDIKNKISFLHNSLQKEEEYKNEKKQLDIELQKTILNQITEKIHETIKMEINERIKADMEAKAFNQNIYKTMETEINKLKKEIEEINKQVQSDIKLVSKDCSERAHNISKYIDQKMLDAVLGKNDSLDKIKKFIDQVIAQVKTNISSQNEQNKLFDQRLKSIEVHIEKSKNDNFGYMVEVEKRFDTKMKYLKTYFEVNMQKHDIFLDNTIKNIALVMDKNINFLCEQIIETRIKENEVYEKMNTSNENKFQSIIYDLEKVCERVYQYENLLNVFDKQNNLLKKNFAESLANLKSRFDVHTVNQKILYTVENNEIQEQVTYLKNKLENSNNELVQNLAKMDQGSQNSISSILLKLEKHENMINLADKLNSENFIRINKRNDENEIKLIMEEMMNNIENQSLIDSLQSSKQKEFDLNKIIENHTENINKLNNETTLNKKSTKEINEKINNISQILNSSGSNLSKAMEDIMKIQREAKELEMKEAVEKIMDSMLTNIETEITSEKMDDMNKFNLQQITTNITNLKKKINILTTSNDTNTTDISSIKLSIESIKKRGLDTQGNHSNCSIKIATNQMLNNVEFNNIYSLLKEGIKNSPVEFTDEMKKKCNELVDNKIQNELEKIKLDNEKLWSNAVDLIQKIKPGDIGEIINNVKPTVRPINETSKILLDVDYYNGKNSKPKVPDLEKKLKNLETEIDENLNIENEKEKNDEKEIENDADMVQIESNKDLSNEKIEEKEKKSHKSKNSKGSKNSNNTKGSKVTKGSKGTKESKGSKNSKNKNITSHKNQNSENMQNNTNESRKKETNEEGEEEGEEEAEDEENEENEEGENGEEED